MTEDCCYVGLSCEPVKDESKQLVFSSSPSCIHAYYRECWYCESEHRLNLLESMAKNNEKRFLENTERTKIINECVDRLNKIESMTAFKDIEACIFEGVQTHLSILKCESKIKEQEESIKKLEGHYYSDGDLSAIHGQLDNLHKDAKHYDHQIDRLEKLHVSSTEMESHLLNRIKALEKMMNIEKKPHKCPVCHGEIKILIDPATPMSGIQAMFGKRDENGMYYKDCKACEGKGIIWG